MLFKNPSELTDKINSEIIAAIWGSGYKHKAHIWGNFPVVGAIWFLPALFYCRSVFSFAYRIVNKLEISPFRRITYLGITSIIISISFTLLDNFVVYLPGSANSGLSAIIFMFIGYSCNHFRRILHNRRILYLAVGIIIINLPVGGFGMANCFYMCYPLNVLGAAATTAIAAGSTPPGRQATDRKAAQTCAWTCRALPGRPAQGHSRSRRTAW